MSSIAEAISLAAPSFTGRFVRSTDQQAHDDRRRVHNGLIEIIVEHLPGAASRIALAATACTLRVAGFNVVIASQWMDADETDRGIEWARGTYASLTPYLAPTRYVNYLEDDAPDPAVVAYGSNLPRLRAIKSKFDPQNFFRQNLNILPL
jgi:FAD/FMN-containing dehydrogenase